MRQSFYSDVNLTGNNFCALHRTPEPRFRFALWIFLGHSHCVVCWTNDKKTMANSGVRNSQMNDTRCFKLETEKNIMAGFLTKTFLSK